MMNIRVLYAILGLSYAAFAQASTFAIRGVHCPMPGLVHGELLAPVSLNSMIG